MKRIVVLLIVLVLMLAGSAGVVFAKNIESQKIVNVKKDEVLDHDFFASGDEVTISGKINGDAYVFAQKLVVDGEINGDLIAAGGEILIPGNVDHDARIAASKISISGTVDGSVTLAAGELVYDRSGRIGNSAVIATSDASLQGYIGRDLTIAASRVTVNNEIGGSILAGIEDLTLDPGARVRGDINYWADNNLTVNMGSAVGGQTIKHEIKDTNPIGRELERSFGGIKFAVKVIGFLFTLILGLVIIKLLPVFSLQIADYIAKRKLKSFLVGALIIVSAPILVLVLLLTVVGIPFALILLFSFILIFCISKIFVALSIGRWLEARLKMYNSVFVKFIGGLIVLTLVSMVPVIGGIFSFAIFCIGVGAFGASTFALQKGLRAKKLI